VIAATLPLLRTYGTAVTTAQIAMAAGIAEGTLFRVFLDKESLIKAAICTAFDPAPAERELDGIDPTLALRDQLIAAVEILQRRVAGVWQLLSMLGMTSPPRQPDGVPEPPRPGPPRRLIAMFEAHRDELRCPPEQAARMLRMMTFAGTHPRIAEGPPLTAAEIVAVVLDGIRRRDELDPEAEAVSLDAQPDAADVAAVSHPEVSAC
jgi:AcrR family transcriptional regulator